MLSLVSLSKRCFCLGRGDIVGSREIWEFLIFVLGGVIREEK